MLFSRLDAIAGADVGEERAVGLVVAVVKGKDQLLVKGYGHADADGGVAMSPNTVIPIGSVTKQLTAAAILQLRDAGKLSLDDPMTKWLPDVETWIFEPLGMTRSRYCDNSENIPDGAFGHGMRNGVFRRAPSIVHNATYAAGAICSTARDMVT